MTPEQIEAKKQQLNKLTEEIIQLKNELVEAGAWPLDEEDLDGVAGGFYSLPHMLPGNPNPGTDPGDR